MARWELIVGDLSRYALVATLEERLVSASGDQYMPSVQLPLGWEEFLPDGATREASRRVQAVSFDLHPSQTPHQPWLRTGLMPVTRAQQPYLPLTHSLIEVLSSLARARPEGDVVLNISVSALAESQDSPGKVCIHWHQGSQPVSISAGKWNGMLNKWGYPNIRLVPLFTELPQQIANGNKAASDMWAAACLRLRLAQEKWRNGYSTDAGTELRHVVQLAIRTWGALWHPESPPAEYEEWGEVSRTVGQDIPGCDVQTWTIERDATADAKRAFARLTVLRSLNAIANPIHHVGATPVYTAGDIEMLLTTAIAMLRSLPELWSQFPGPLLAAASEPSQSAS